MKANKLFATDLQYILQSTKTLWEPLRNGRLFITGGTGFFGCWLLESFVYACEQLELNAKAVVLTRDPSAFAKKCPHLFANAALSFIAGDVRNFSFPPGEFTHIIHAATDASATVNEHQPLQMLSTIIDGTKHVLEFAKLSGAKQFLLISSGAVYGKQPAHISHLSEDHLCALNTVDKHSAYAIGKCTAEHLATLYGTQYGLNVKIARCFAFVGPYLPLNIHYAIGNFIRDALVKKSIVIQGDGTPLRSYLYAADLMVWLWTILFSGVALRPYNVGSNEAFSIADIARLVLASTGSDLSIEILQTPQSGIAPLQYVPSVNRARTELNLQAPRPLSEAIRKTYQWFSQKESIV